MFIQVSLKICYQWLINACFGLNMPIYKQEPVCSVFSQQENYSKQRMETLE